MSTISDIEKEIIDQSDSICHDYSAVFTLTQTQKIIEIDRLLLNPLLTNLDELKCKIAVLTDVKVDDHIDGELKKLENEIVDLVQYDEHNSCLLNKMSRDIVHLTVELQQLDERVAKALLCQAEELDKVAKEEECLLKQVKDLSCREMKDQRMDAVLDMINNFVTRSEIDVFENEVKSLACREFKDSRVEEILRKLSCLEAKDYLDPRIDQIIHMLSCFESKEDIEKIIHRLTCLESRKFEDERVAALINKLSIIEKKIDHCEAINVDQCKEIHCLSTENLRQSNEIKCLSEKLNRNSMILDSKIETVQNSELCDQKIDANQSAQIEVLQSQMARLNIEMDKLQRALLTKPIC